MILTLQEMETLCLFHSGTRAATVELLRRAASEAGANAPRANDLNGLADKLAPLPENTPVCIRL